MKKVIAAFDGLKFSDSTKDYACHVVKLANAHLVGVFLEDVTYTGYKIYDLITDKGVSEKVLRQYEEKDRISRHNAILEFEAACKKASLNYSLHRDRNIALKDLLHESVYTDLVIIDSKETLTHYDEKIPTRFIRELLAHVQSPVLLVPQKYKPIEKVVMLYDGEPSSVYAMKMFSYMFPFLNQIDIEVITGRDIDQSMHMPDNKLMKEFMKRHYPKAMFKVLKGLPEEEIVKYIKENGPNVLVVLGAYQRGTVSRWLRASMADILMKELKVPLFIAHHK